MFTCQYCGTQFAEHRPNCPNCGAVIKVDSQQAPKRVALENAPDAIRGICEQYQKDESIFFDDAIDAARLAHVITKFEIPANEIVILLYDDTVFNAKPNVGFAVCSGGLHWRNDWTVSSKRKHLTWEEFAKRDVALNGLQIDLGFGDAIGVAGCGSDEVRGHLLSMLREIQSLFK